MTTSNSDVAADEDATALDDRSGADFLELLEFLKRTRGFDFTDYKLTGLARRFRKRMQTVGVEGFADYRDYLEVHAGEFNALFNAILINVTAFFRDEAAWQYLREEVVPALLAAKGPTAPIRAWVAGCASGEEAYTLALVLAEALGVEQFGERVKIYATDVDEEALAHARQAVYTARDVEGVPAALRERYFDLADGRYTVRRELRRSVIFGRNDLVQDAPISRVDLLTCRNTLMYLNAELQARILARFHFALNDGGFLFLGRAEMLFAHTNLFQPHMLRWRVFTRLPHVLPRDRVLLPLRPGAYLDGAEAGEARLARIREAVLETASTAQMAVDPQGYVVQINAQARALFGLTPLDVGRLFRDMELFYKPADLRRLVEQAHAERRPPPPLEMHWTAGGEGRHLDVQASPLLGTAGEALGVALSFTDVTRARQLQVELEETHRELETAYEELQSINEEMETTNEELQSINEELETTNEELQSSNEELETTNEELQSTNEELQNINDEMRQRGLEMDHLNDFLGCILASLRGGVAVVDADLTVQSWSDKAQDLWGLRAAEAVGRHVFNLDIGLPVEPLRPAMRACLTGGQPDPVTLEAVNRRGRPIRCRVTCLPLSGRGAAPRGVILLMEDTETDLPGSAGRPDAD